jgi:hypothetical protein
MRGQFVHHFGSSWKFSCLKSGFQALGAEGMTAGEISRMIRTAASTALHAMNTVGDKTCYTFEMQHYRFPRCVADVKKKALPGSALGFSISLRK